MYQKFYSIRFFFISLLLSIGIGITANGQDVNMYMDQNWQSPLASGDGSQPGDVIAFRTEIWNNGGVEPEITNSVLYAPIPAGTTYIPGTTIVNGAAVPDINGKMPFASGGLINSPGSAPGVIAHPWSSNDNPVVEYAVKVTANAGIIFDYATLQGTKSSGSIEVKALFYLQLAPSSCNTIYQSTASTPFGTTYNYIRTLSPTNGTAVATIFTPSGPCYNIINGVPASTTAGTVLTDAQAMALDPNANRLYFINKTTNNPAQDLCYLDLNASPVAAYKYVGYKLETNTATGYNIDRMTWGSDGYGYALTANGQDLIRFSIDPSTNLPVIQPLGPLVNDANNGTNDVLASTGGDLVADGSGKLYLYVNTNRILYRINPATRVATSLGIMRTVPSGGATALAADEAGNILMGGSLQNVYKIDQAGIGDGSITSSTSNVYKTGDYASCGLPVFTADLNAVKTYTNTTGNATVRAGDPIEFTIEVSNPGNTAATAVKLYDAIPAGCHYIPNSTTMDGVAVPDIGGAMPFSVSGGGFISTRLEAANGIIKSGDINKVLIKFRVTTDENVTICNRASLTFTDANENVRNILSADYDIGNSSPTCFQSGNSSLALQATKTYINTFTQNKIVVSGNPVEYTIVVTNTGGIAPASVQLFDAIPTYSQYIPGSTTLNGVAVADINGEMPFAVSGGGLINSPSQSAGIVTPGNTAVIKFRVTTDPIKTVCNQATVTFKDAAGIAKNIVTDDPDQAGQNATCFYSDGPPLGGRIAVNGTTNNDQSVLQPAIESVQVRPNPFINDLNLLVQVNTDHAIQVRLIDFYGRTVYATSQKLATGANSLNLHLPAGLSSGMYLLDVSAGNKRVFQKKLFKQ